MWAATGVGAEKRDVAEGHHPTPIAYVAASQLESSIEGAIVCEYDGVSCKTPGGSRQAMGCAAERMPLPSAALPQAESESKDDIVSRAFTALAAGKRSAASRGAIAQRTAEAAPVASHEAAPAALTLERLAIQLGPDLRAVYPFVLNFGLAGEVQRPPAPAPLPCTCTLCGAKIATAAGAATRQLPVRLWLPFSSGMQANTPQHDPGEAADSGGSPEGHSQVPHKCL